MSVNKHAPLTITGCKWAPDFTNCFVRDVRPRWAFEDIWLSITPSASLTC